MAKNGRNVSNRRDRFSLAAACEGNANLVQLLLDAGATVNALSGRHNGSALYITSGNGHYKVVKQLLTAKADPNIEGGKYGSALCYAARGGHARVVELLLGASADVNRRVKRTHPDASYAAISRCSVECVDILISAGASAQITNTTYALHTTVSCGYEELVDKLFDSGADPNSCIPSPGFRFMFPFLLAAYGSFGTIVGRTGANPDEIDVKRSALLLAVYGTEGTVEVLLASGADPNNPPTLTTSLATAVRKGSKLTMKRLLAAGADKRHAKYWYFVRCGCFHQPQCGENIAGRECASQS